MPGDVSAAFPPRDALPSAALAAAVRAEAFADRAVTVLGYGAMGREYVKALRSLGVRRVTVCSRSAAPLEALRGVEGLETQSGGYAALRRRADDADAAIVAVPTAELAPAARHLAGLGFRELLIEKPVALRAAEIEALHREMSAAAVRATAAYNRVAYPSFHEVAARACDEGGITSCTYTFTEFIPRLDPSRYPPEEMRRWGIANSLHVMSMAHGLIGWPDRYGAFRSGEVAWHPAGAVFVGAGISRAGIPFAYHADWGSTGRWSVEVHTARASYRLCPLEQVFQRTAPTAEWEEIPVVAAAPEVKVGFVEQVAALLSPRLRKHVPLVSLSAAAALTRFGENIFGYAEETEEARG